MLGRCCCSSLLTTASCSAARHCSTPRPARPVTSGTARPTERAARPCEATATRGNTSAPTGQRGTRGPTHTDAEGASRRLGRIQCEGQRESSLTGGTSTRTRHLASVPYLLTPPQHSHPHRRLLPKLRLSTTNEPPAEEAHEAAHDDDRGDGDPRDRAG